MIQASRGQLLTPYNGGVYATGPVCRIPFCQTYQWHGRVLEPHIALWLVTYNAEEELVRLRWRWYCAIHLPPRYTWALVDEGVVAEEAAEKLIRQREYA